MKRTLLSILLIFCSFGLAFGQLSEGFEGGIPSDWSLYQSESDDPGFVINDLEAHTGTKCAYHNYAYITTESDSWLVSSAQTITVGVNEFLSFWYQQGDTATFYNYSGVYISTASNDPITNPGDFVELQEFNAAFGYSEDEWTEYVKDLSSYAGETVYIAFKYVGNGDHVFYIDDVEMSPTPDCFNPSATYEVVADCEEGEQFLVDVNISDLGGDDDVNITDNQTPPETQVAGDTGIYTFGPYPNGTEVQFTLENSTDAGCSTMSNLLTQEYCSAYTVNCDEGPINSTFCYGEGGQTMEVTYTSSDPDSVLNLTVNAGEVEVNYDSFTVLDTDNSVIYTGDGDLTGLSFQSTGDVITIQIAGDEYNSCFSGTYDSIDITVDCADCINPQANYTVVSDCNSGTDQFYVDVDITSLGTANSLTISDNQTPSNTEPNADALEVYNFGPYPNGTDVVFTIENNDDPDCSITSESLSQLYCPPANDDCLGAIEVPVNDTGECIEIASGTMQGATLSTTPDGGACVSTTAHDVWFQFTATSDTHAISVSNLQSSTSASDLYHAVYEGADCDNLSLLYCSGTETSSLAEGLTPDETYWVRVFSNADDPEEDTTFDICVSTPGAPITTNTTQYTVEELVIDKLINTPCAQVSQINYTTGTNFGDVNGIGYFENNGGDFPFADGIILSSGNVDEAEGPEIGGQSNGTYDWLGDSELEALIQEIDGSTFSTSHNASVIEFDFVPYVSEISFNFLFASEEYGTYQCDFSDPFAFFLTDSDGNTTNLAVIPGTTTPISVVTIRDEAYNDACDSQNEGYFGSYYGDNGLPPITSPTNFLGSTTVMTAYSQVTPGEQYHIKLAVSDRNDTSFDSAVFLEAGSFDIGQPDLGDDLTVAAGTAPCDGEEVILDPGMSGTNFEYLWFKDGFDQDHVLAGEEGSTLTVTEPGHYYLQVYNLDGCAPGPADIEIEFYDSPDVDLGDDLSICASGSATLNATPSNPNDFDSIGYSWEDENGVEVSTDATYEVTTPGTYTVTVSGNDEDGSGNIVHTCEVTDTIVISDLASFTVDIGADQIFCGVESYTLMANMTGEDPADASFVWSDASGPIAGETSQNLTITDSGAYSVEVTVNGCSLSSDVVNIVFNEVPDIPLTNVNTCDLSAVVLNAAPSNLDPDTMHYVWTYNGNNVLEGDGSSFATLTPSDYGSYKVEVSYIGDSSCMAIKTVTVSERNPSVSISVNDEDELYCVGETAILTADLTDANPEEATFVWSDANGPIAGETAQAFSVDIDDSYPNTTYHVTATIGGCEVVSGEVTLGRYPDGCDIPRGVSPGNDAINNCLDLSFLADRSGIESLKIYNRYGRLVYEQKNYIDSWCGQDKDGNDLITGTYYYILVFKKEDPVFGKVKKSWIYVNREVN